MHLTLDDGTLKGDIPEPHVKVLKEILALGSYDFLVSSYIGYSLGQGREKEEESRRKRENAKFQVGELAKRLNLTYSDDLSTGPESSS